MPKRQRPSVSIAETMSAYHSYLSKTNYHYAISRGIKGGLAGTVFKNYKAQFGKYPDGLTLDFEAWKRSRYPIIYAEPVVISDEPIIISFPNANEIVYPETVYSYWGF
jgi:hypothetical protein